MTLAHNPDVVGDGAQLVIYDVRKPRWLALQAGYSKQVQQLEDALWQLYLKSMLPNATGALLDQLGALVLQPRENRTDDVYRLWIRAKALVLRSSGRPAELLTIARLVLPSAVRIVMVMQYPAALEIRLEGAIAYPSSGADVAALLLAAAASGVRLLVTYTSSETPFRYPASGLDEFASPVGYGAGVYAAVSGSV